MSREWQQTRYKEFLMPDAVFYQSIWAVRDLNRMEERLRELEKEEDRACSTSIVSDSRNGYAKHTPTEKHAMEKVILNERITAIRQALYMVPECYRKPILQNIISKNERCDCPGKIWRVWKQRFLYQVAKNLSIM